MSILVQVHAHIIILTICRNTHDEMSIFNKVTVTLRVMVTGLEVQGFSYWYGYGY
jgi:hypothetical protein